MTWPFVLARVVGALLGAAGVAAAAASTHAGSAVLGSLALIALTHAPALLALGLGAPATRSYGIATVGLGLGALVFCADLALRQTLGSPLFPMAAPLGGGLMILGWLAVAMAALVSGRR